MLGFSAVRYRTTNAIEAKESGDAGVAAMTRCVAGIASYLVAIVPVILVACSKYGRVSRLPGTGDAGHGQGLGQVRTRGKQARGIGGV